MPQVSAASFAGAEGLVAGHQAVEILYSNGVMNLWKALKQKHPEMLISIKLPLDGNEAEIAEQLTRQGVEMIHLYADDHGNEFGAANPRFIKDMVRAVHLHLVERALRDQVTLLGSGGIAMAEHVAKIIICGVDAVAMDVAVLIALECRLCRSCEKHRPCPVTIGASEPGWGSQRILNLMSAWRNQLLEVLGAMGIREMRRLRGEVGRSMFFEELEADVFGRMFGERI
jgi:glutamate synthase domain-containing protein 2